MSFYRSLMTFSPNGEYFANSCADGCLKIWETSTSILKQEYTPSSHLSSTCSSLCWCPSLKRNASKTNKKSRSSVCSSVGQLQLIAMGTFTGDVMLYSFANADLHTYYKNGHSAAVNDVCWHISSNSLFTCSNDLHIIIWDISSGKIKSNWKADKVAIYSLCVIDENNLLSASTSITWWDIKSKAAIKRFSGHATEVFRMLPFVVQQGSTISHFMSSAVGDRVINAWNLNESQTTRTVASFVCSGEPSSISLTTQGDEPLKMAVVTKDGIFHLFTHTLNGRRKKPLQPSVTVQIASKVKAESAKPSSVPILATNISEGLDSCLLVYGTLIKPTFERIDLSEHSTDLYLVRDISYTPLSLQESVSKVKQTEKSANVKILAPGHMSDNAVTNRSLKKRNEKEISELPMEEHLKALDLSKLPENVSEAAPAIKVDSMVHLLTQGLQSKDNNMLNAVLQNSNEDMIRNTIQRLPLQTILLVLKELFTRLNKQENSGSPCVTWLYELLAIHLPYLMSCRDVDDYLGPIGRMIEARVENFAKMSQLKGCLNVLLSQSLKESQSYDDSVSKALVDYRSESSDEEDEIDVEVDNEIDADGKQIEPLSAEELTTDDTESSDSDT